MAAQSINAARRTHLFWLGLYFLLDISWIRFDQFAYWHDAFSYSAVLHGTGCAPEQYRVGGPFAAQCLARLLHVHSISAAFIVIDFFSAALLSLLLYTLLLRELRTVHPVFHSTAKALLGLWMAFFLYSSYAYARVETLPSCICVALFLSLVGRWDASFKPLATFAVVLLSFVQGWVRADVAVTLGIALCLAALLPPTRPRRAAVFITGILAAFLSGGSLLYLMKMVYPTAHYCGSVIEVRANVTLMHNYLAFLTVLPPLLLGIVVLVRRFSTASVADRTLLIALALYITLWSTFGNWSEARIIAPFAMSLIPITAVAMARFADTEPSA